MRNVEEFLVNIRTMAIAGHIRPDGDAVGTCMALYLYVREYHPEIDVDVYLDHPNPVFGHIDCIGEVKMTQEDPFRSYDLFVTCDVSSPDRLSLGAQMFPRAGHTVCIDHHISNTGFADENHVEGTVSSCSEVLYDLMDPGRVNRSIAVALYTGMIHDTGVFRYPSVTPKTMRVAAALMEQGFDFSRIIDESFYQKSYVQNQVMGRVLAESIMIMDGRVIVGYIRRREMSFYGIVSSDLDGIVAQLRLTKGTEAAVFLYETEPMKFKVSMRSNGNVDVSRVAVYFGGGGHFAAAGCEMAGSVYDVINNLTEQIARQLEPEYEEASSDTGIAADETAGYEED